MSSPLKSRPGTLSTPAGYPVANTLAEARGALNALFASCVFFFVGITYAPFTMREQHTPGADPVADFRHFGRAKLLRYALAALVTGLGAAVVGPFGSYESMYTGPRFIFWISATSLGWAQMLLISYATRGFIGSRPILFEVRFLARWLTDGAAEFPPLWQGYLNVYAITLIFSMVQWLVVERWSLFPGRDLFAAGPTGGAEPPPDARAATASSVGDAAPADDPAALRLRRMPDGVDGEILCLQMEDHYLCVHTATGRGLVLQRLADAVEELAQADGMQVHRSWWVARHAVSGHETVKRQKFLLLSNGLRVPVSRSYLAAVREAGWI